MSEKQFHCEKEKKQYEDLLKWSNVFLFGDTVEDKANLTSAYQPPPLICFACGELLKPKSKQNKFEK